MINEDNNDGPDLDLGDILKAIIAIVGLCISMNFPIGTERTKVTEKFTLNISSGEKVQVLEKEGKILISYSGKNSNLKTDYTEEINFVGEPTYILSDVDRIEANKVFFNEKFSTFFHRDNTRKTREYLENVVVYINEEKQ